jgi:hypothetical protein
MIQLALREEEVARKSVRTGILRNYSGIMEIDHTSRQVMGWVDRRGSRSWLE